MSVQFTSVPFPHPVRHRSLIISPCFRPFAQDGIVWLFKGCIRIYFSLTHTPPSTVVHLSFYLTLGFLGSVCVFSPFLADVLRLFTPYNYYAYNTSDSSLSEYYHKLLHGLNKAFAHVLISTNKVHEFINIHYHIKAFPGIGWHASQINWTHFISSI